MTTGNRLVGARRVRVRGLVQGVGFRPFVYRLAERLALVGWVRNDADGVLVHVEGSEPALAAFEQMLHAQAPPLAAINAVETADHEPAGYEEFVIEPSPPGDGAGRTRVPADRVACAACLNDVLDPHDRRHDYPFTTCTDCGPRFSIVRAMPYDRERTTMAEFPLCRRCRAEYEGPFDRRFHAEPIACPTCGPRVWLTDAAGQDLADGELAIRAAAEQLQFGQIVALKGLGGFQLLVRADSSGAVARLRQRKRRPTKPFAVMVPSLTQVRLVAHTTAVERALLAGPAGPIVLLRRRAGSCVSPVVAPRGDLLGVMLPTTPLHHLLLRECDFPVVATSGNVSDDPIEIDERAAVDRLNDIADLFLLHNRPIARRVDDSVARVIADTPVLLRLARGHAPAPLPALERWIAARPNIALPPMLAVGGQQKSAVALWTGRQAVLGPHIGDLESVETANAFAHSIADLQALYACRAAAVAADRHPDYHSRRWADASGLPVVAVQHHHAHAAACMVEHDLLDKEILAFTWDGTGLGDDGTIWGGEVLRARLDGYTRVATLAPFGLPGGEAAIREPGRVALALLLASFDRAAVLADEPLLARLGLTPPAARTLAQLIDRGLNCPVTTSMGRLFDAVAALALGAARVSYEGEAAAWLEAAVDDSETTAYPLPLVEEDSLLRADWQPLVRALVTDLRGGATAGRMAARFHHALTGWAAEVAARHTGLPVVLGGGCFQNRRLVEAIRDRLTAAGRAVYHAGAIPPGDGGLAAGQLAVALARRATASAGG